tara:strand:+ start:963 stop:1616 length:654 start_codon:yes stop_codon:yes gene_type:complete
MDYDIVNFKNYDNCNSNCKNFLKLIFKRFNFKRDDYTIIEPDIILPPNIRNTNIFTTIPIEEIKSFIKISKLSTIDVKRQLRIDIPRSKLYCNSEYVDDVESFIDYLQWKVDIKKFILIGILCTQIVFAYPITNIGLNLRNYTKDYFICELEEHALKGYVINLSLYTINRDTTFNIEIKKRLRLCRIPLNGEPKTVYTFTIFIKICDGFYTVDIDID